MYVYVFQLNARMTYNKKMRLSDWHIMPLTSDQQSHAAFNAYVRIYLVYTIMM